MPGDLEFLTADYIFSSNSHGTFFRIDHMLGHKIRFKKFKRIEIKVCYPTTWNKIRN